MARLSHAGIGSTGMFALAALGLVLLSRMSSVTEDQSSHSELAPSELAPSEATTTSAATVRDARPTPPPRRDDARRATPVAHGSRRAIAAATRSTAEVAPAVEPARETTSWYRMRRPSLAPADPGEGITAASDPAPPPSRLVPRRYGWLVRDRLVPMQVARDGRVVFRGERDFEIHWVVPFPSLAKLADHIRAWSTDPYAQTRTRAVADMPKHEQAMPGGWDSGAGGDHRPDGKLRDNGRPASLFEVDAAGTVPILGGSLDVTAWAMRRTGAGDPYASRKRALIEATFDDRARIAAEHDSVRGAR